MSNRFMKSAILTAAILGAVRTAGCGSSSSDKGNGGSGFPEQELRDSLTAIAADCPGRIGVALIADSGDTLTVNNDARYSLMSVFKLHQAIALCDALRQRGTSPDTVVTIDASRLNPDTWSPMLKEHPEKRISISVRDLMRYTLTQSDNNASNYLFDDFNDVAATDSFIATLIPRDDFRLSVTEAQMWDDHSLCYENLSTPMGVARLMERLFTDNVIAPDDREFICRTLGECATGTDRIVAPLADKNGVKVFHKTGSGFRTDDGILTAHNDAAYITLPDGRHYTLVVLVRDFKGSEEEAARAIARVSAAVYSVMYD